MRTRLLRWTLLIGRGCLFCAPAGFVGSGHDRAAAAMAESAYLRQSHRQYHRKRQRLRRRNIADSALDATARWAMATVRSRSGSIPQCGPSPAIFSWAYSNAVPLPPALCPPMRICSIPSLAAWTVPACRSGAHLPSKSVPIWWPGSSTSLPAWQNEKPGTPIMIPPEPEVTPERIKAGREVFARVSLLEVPRRPRYGQWPISPYSYRRSGSADRAL